MNYDAEESLLRHLNILELPFNYESSAFINIEGIVSSSVNTDPLLNPLDPLFLLLFFFSLCHLQGNPNLSFSPFTITRLVLSSSFGFQGHHP
jgi:hypothetical protein